MRIVVPASALVGAAIWFIVFFGPQWGFLGQGYRPNAIVLGATLLLAGVGGQALRQRPSTLLERLGIGGLLTSVLFFAVEAPLWSPVGNGVFLDATIEDWTTALGPRLLPFATAALMMGRARRAPGSGRPVLGVTVALLGLAALLAVPSTAGRMEPWDFVARYAFLLTALVLVAAEACGRLGGPSLRVVRRTPRTA